MKIKNIAEKVEAILRTHPRARDNDNMLIAAIWAGHIRANGLDTESLTAKSFFKIMAYESDFPSPESIRRSRQKLQENHPELRGTKYKDRQGSLQLETQEEIRRM